MKVDVHHFENKPTPLLRRFEAAQVTDKEAERKLRLFRVGCVGFAVATAASFFLAINYPWLFALSALLLTVVVVFAIQARKYTQYDLDDRKLETVVRLLQMLRVDTPPDEDVKLAVDFRDYRKGGKQLSRQSSGVFNSETSYKYSHGWLDLSGILADGNGFRLAVTESIYRKERKKRKYTKVKERIQGLVTVEVRLKVSRYGDPQAVMTALEQAPSPAPLVLKKIRVRGRKLAVSLVTEWAMKTKGRYGPEQHGQEHLIDGDAVLGALLWVYNALGTASGKAA